MIARVDSAHGIYYIERAEISISVKGEHDTFENSMCSYNSADKDDIVAVVDTHGCGFFYLKAGDSVEINGEDISFPEE
ncbi:hypothetical protein DRO66_00555 [Candidatus Bathyarchaeota archaeon]|nr:MAG: hypothetical protein DRO66_00555 [Candidatus Bathyarchaeota archaeon]